MTLPNDASAEDASAAPRARPREIVLIAALGAENRVIGRGLDLPWHLPEDLRHFKHHTLGHTMLMGRRTYEALLHQMGRPLPGRTTVVVSEHALPDLPAGVVHYGGLDEALAALAPLDVLYVAGGGTVYAQTLALADRLELTLVDGAPEGDVFFPPFAHLVGTVFEETARTAHPPAGGRPGFAFVTYRRV